MSNIFGLRRTIVHHNCLRSRRFRQGTALSLYHVANWSRTSDSTKPLWPLRLAGEEIGCFRALVLIRMRFEKFACCGAALASVFRVDMLVWGSQNSGS